MLQGPTPVSRRRAAAWLRGLANQLQGKTASLTDDETLEQLVEFEVASLGSGSLRDVAPKAMADVERAAYAYEHSIEKVLLSWVRDHMEELRLEEPGPLKQARTPSAVVDKMMTLRGGASYLYFMEAEGHGVGTWDGDWDPMFKDPRKSIKELSRLVAARTRNDYRALKTAIMNAALSTET